MNTTVKSTLILTLTAMIWGSAFVAQKSGMDHIGPFLFSGIRGMIGSLTLLVFIFFRRYAKNSKNKDTNSAVASSSQDKALLLRGGIACGLIMFFASNLQQVALVFTTASKTGFITTLYIIIVPIMGIFLHHKTHWNTWISVAIATAGLYLLCITESLSIQPGDLIVLISALFWAAHILVIDHFAPKVDVVKMSCIQFVITGVLSLITSPFLDGFFTDSVTMSNIMAAMPTILYAGILSSGVAFTLQMIGQKYANPTAASIILSTESVFGVIGGFLILGERFTGRETIGCLLMFLAVILAQLPSKNNRSS